MNVCLIPTNFEKDSKIVYIKHPRTNLSSPFLVIKDKVYELLEVDRGSSSFLLAQQVISNGKILLAVEFHPLFLALPLIMERKSEMHSLDGYFDDTNLKDVEFLIRPYFYLVCQQSNISGYVVWSYNEKMMLNWLCDRVSKLILYFKSTKQNNEESINDVDFVDKSFDVMKHYIKATLAQTLKEELKIRYPGSFHSLSSSLNSKTQENSIENPKNHTSTPNSQIPSKSVCHEKNQINLIQKKKTSKKEIEAKKKKKEKTSKCSIESFFLPQKEK